jgi:hypothetical protein
VITRLQKKLISSYNKYHIRKINVIFRIYTKFYNIICDLFILLIYKCNTKMFLFILFIWFIYSAILTPAFLPSCPPACYMLYSLYSFELFHTHLLECSQKFFPIYFPFIPFISIMFRKPLFSYK